MSVRAVSTVTGAVLAIGLTAPAAFAGAAPEEAVGMLLERGYRHVQVEPDPRPGYLAYACKRRTHFRIQIDRAGNIVDVEPVGRCNPRRGPRKVHIQVPFADVRVGQRGVRVRAPFVDIRVPQR